MLYPYISQFNWIDILVIICIIRMSYVGIKTGFGVELFKALNLFFCCFIALHFYMALAEFIHSKVNPLPVEAAALFSYVVLILVITIILRIVREGFLLLVKWETQGTVERWVGLFIGFMRGVFISGLVLFGLLISTIHYFELSTRTSFLGSRIVQLPVRVYEIVLNGLVVKISPDQSLNQKVVEVLEGGKAVSSRD